MEILGFAPTGEPILPASHSSQDMDVIRREKLSWDEITVKAAKVVSFIGMCLSTVLTNMTQMTPRRPRGP